MSRPFLIFSQSDYLIQVVDANSNTEWKIVQIQISNSDLDQHCLQRQGISEFSRTRIIVHLNSFLSEWTLPIITTHILTGGVELIWFASMEFYAKVNTVKVMTKRPVKPLTLFLGKLSPLISDQPVLYAYRFVCLEIIS